MPRLPVHPDLASLERQAAEMHASSAGDTLADARLALAQSYGAPSWERMELSCRLIDAIWQDDLDTVRALVTLHPHLVSENAGIGGVNWGPPLSYAANLGRDRIITLLDERGATDLEHAMDRAVLQGRIETARMLHRMLGSPRPSVDLFGGAAYTLSVTGTEFLFEIGGQLVDARGGPSAPADVVLETDSRKPEAKHRILELYVAHGFELPDTPIMALHRGRLDLLERHLQRDPGLLTRTFSYAEIFPPSLGCHATEDLPRTTLAGTTLLHVCVEFDELDIARWLIAQGMNADVPAATDAEGYGGHTALFGAVVSYRNFWMNFTGGWAHSRKPVNAGFAELLLDAGADPNARASLREQIWTGDERTLKDHRDLTPLGWGEAFHNRMIVSAPAMQLIRERGGRAP